MADFDLTSDLESGDVIEPSGSVPATQGLQPQVGSQATPEGLVRPEQAVAAPQAAPDAAKAGEKPKSLRDQLSAAFKGEDGKPAEQQAAQSNTGEQPRDATGKFAPKAGEQPAQNTQPQPAPADLALRYMSPTEVQQFNTLPAEMQQVVARTMAGLEQHREQVQHLASIEQIIGPRRQPWAMNGMTPEGAITQLLALSDFATNQPAQFVQYFAQQQGIDLNALVNAAPEHQGFVDPTVRQLQQQVGQLTGHINQITTGQQQQAHQNMLAEVERWSQEKDGAGTPLRPHFGDVMSDIPPLLEYVRTQFPAWTPQQHLQEAYDRAVRANPQTFAKLQAEMEAKRLSELRSRSATAKAAGASVSGAPAGGQSAAAIQPGSGSVRDLLKQQFASVGAQV